MSLGRVPGPGRIPGPSPIPGPPTAGEPYDPRAPYARPSGPPRGGDPWAIEPPRAPRRPAGRRPFLAPLVALVGLVLVAGASFAGIAWLGASLGGSEVTGQGPGETTAPEVTAAPGVEASEELSTPSPTPTIDLGAVVTPAPEEGATVKGTILFTRGGNIWAVSGQDYRQISRKGTDSAPSWSSDGKSIYFVETRVRTADAIGPKGKYTLYYPNIMRMKPNGKKRKEVYGSLYRSGKEFWFSWVLEPDISPNGRTIALVSDGRDGSGEVTLHTMSSKGGRLTSVRAPSRSELGHNDPAWSPDGKQLAFTMNGRDGQIGAPVIGIHTPKTGRTRLLKRGFANPSWSPDGKWLAAERTTGNGRDVVIIDPRRGDPVPLTNDGDSFSPVVSPDGDQIAYLHRDGLGIDLRLMTLAFQDGRVTLINDQAITEDGSLDADSSPAWFIPRDQRKPPPSAVLPEPSPSTGLTDEGGPAG